MSFKKIEGTIEALGNHVFDKDNSVYGYVRILDKSGAVVEYNDVLISNKANSYIAIGATGTFFFCFKNKTITDIFYSSYPVLYGVITNGRTVFDDLGLKTQSDHWRLIGFIGLLVSFFVWLFVKIGGFILGVAMIKGSANTDVMSTAPVQFFSYTIWGLYIYIEFILLVMEPSSYSVNGARTFMDGKTSENVTAPSHEDGYGS